MKTEEAKEIYRQRQRVIKDPIGDYKENLGFRERLTRGIKAVRNEFNLVCTAVNLKKIWIYSNENEIIPKINGINGTFHFKT